MDEIEFYPEDAISQEDALAAADGWRLTTTGHSVTITHDPDGAYTLEDILSSLSDALHMGLTITITDGERP